MWDQGSNGWDQESEGLDLVSRPWEQGSQTMGSGSAVFLGSGIRLYPICGIRDENWSHVWNQGSEICVQK